MHFFLGALRINSWHAVKFHTLPDKNISPERFFFQTTVLEISQGNKSKKVQCTQPAMSLVGLHEISVLIFIVICFLVP